MKRARINDAGSFLELVLADSGEFDSLLNEITVGETYFYRDPKQFEFIKEAVFPAVARPLRMWSAGCSTGEEAYSLAIALEECGLESGSHVFGTDISQAALAAAREGAYGDWSFREIDSMWRARYFTRCAKNRWKIAPRFSTRVSFEAGNLADMRPSGGYDVILCRNVLMYLESDVVTRVTKMLLSALRDGGWLFTSPSDPIISEDSVEIVNTPSGLAYRRSAARIVLAAVECADAPVYRQSVPARSQAPSPQTPVRSIVSSLKPQAAVAPIADETLDPQHYVREAMEFLDANRAGEAAIAARRAIFLDRSNAFAHLLLGRALRLGGRTVAARRSLGRAQRLSLDGDGIAASVVAELSLLATRPSSIGAGV